PTTAIYVLLASIVAPALVKMGVTPMGAHLFILYFGVLSFLTPPVAVSSYVAAGIAGADMWRTGWTGMRMSIMASLLPFLWCFDPALLMDGSWLSILVVCCTTLASILLIARGVGEIRGGRAQVVFLSVLTGAIVLAIGTSPVWLGHESMLALLAAALGFALYWLMPLLCRRLAGVAQVPSNPCEVAKGDGVPTAGALRVIIATSEAGSRPVMNTTGTSSIASRFPRNLDELFRSRACARAACRCRRKGLQHPHSHPAGRDSRGAVRPRRARSRADRHGQDRQLRAAHPAAPGIPPRHRAARADPHAHA